MNLKARISKLEEKSGDKQPWNRVVSVVTHGHYPPEKLDTFLQENGFNPDDPGLLVIIRRIVDPGGRREMFEPYFTDGTGGAPNA